MSYRITAPVTGYNGDVVGVAFTDGEATTGEESAVAYFRRHGYKVEPIGENVGAAGHGAAPTAPKRQATKSKE